jgi:hypothetical protein
MTVPLAQLVDESTLRSQLMVTVGILAVLLPILIALPEIRVTLAVAGSILNVAALLFDITFPRFGSDV